CLYLGFGVCQGDLRLGYLFGLLLGAIAWEATAGQLLRPVFAIFWKGLGKLAAAFSLPLKKILKFTKILFASGEKWVTIMWNHYRQRKPGPGGKKHGRKSKAKEKPEIADSPHGASAGGSGGCTYSVFYGSPDGVVVGSRKLPGRNGQASQRGRRTGV